MKFIIIIFCISISCLCYSQKDMKKSDCSKFRTGEFVMDHESGGEIKIIRNDTMQYETFEDSINTEWKIKWTGDCEYNLTLLKPYSEASKPFVGKTIKVKIISVKGNTYKYYCYYEGDAEVVMDEMTKIK